MNATLFELPYHDTPHASDAHIEANPRVFATLSDTVIGYCTSLPGEEPVVTDIEGIIVTATTTRTSTGRYEYTLQLVDETLSIELVVVPSTSVSCTVSEADHAINLRLTRNIATGDVDMQPVSATPDKQAIEYLQHITQVTNELVANLPEQP